MRRSIDSLFSYLPLLRSHHWRRRSSRLSSIMQKYSLKPIPATKNHNFEQGKCLATQKEGRRKRREGRGEREEERVQRREGRVKRGECREESAECRGERGKREGCRVKGAEWRGEPAPSCNSLTKLPLRGHKACLRRNFKKREIYISEFARLFDTDRCNFVRLLCPHRKTILALE